MPTLNWIGKEAVVNHDKEVPFKLLKKVKTASVGDNSQNLIIHGDNLEGLKKGRVLGGFFFALAVKNRVAARLNDDTSFVFNHRGRPAFGAMHIIKNQGEVSRPDFLC